MYLPHSCTLAVTVVLYVWTVEIDSVKTELHMLPGHSLKSRNLKRFQITVSYLTASKIINKYLYCRILVVS